MDPNLKNPIQPQETMIKHHEMVKALAKSGEQIAAEINADDAHLMHMAIGISGEAGELLDAIKKQVIYRKPLDRENVLEELGDLEFYMEGIRQGLGITREQCLEANIAKLGKRYQGMIYSDGAAQERADKTHLANLHSKHGQERFDMAVKVAGQTPQDIEWWLEVATPNYLKNRYQELLSNATIDAREKHPWYPKNSFRRFSKPVCGTSCKVCNGFALEIEEDRERPCPSCYPGPPETSSDS